MTDNLVRTEVSLDEIHVGMTIELNGQLITVNQGDVKRDAVWGCSFRGDSSRKTFTRAQFAVPTAFGIVLR